MSESAVERLLKKAEEAVDSDEYEKAFNYTNIASAYIEQRGIELELLNRSMEAADRAG